MLAREGVHDAGGQLLHVGAVDPLADLLDQDGVGLADVKDEVLLLVGEQAADHIVGRDVPARYHPDDEHHPGHIGGKVQLPRLGIDVAGQDVVQHHVLDKIGFVELFVVVLLDALQADRQHGGKLGGGLVRALYKHGVIVVLGAGKLLVTVTAPGKAVLTGHALGHKVLLHLADQIQLRAGDDGAGLIHHTDHTVDRVLHLVDHALKYSVGHKRIPLFLDCTGRETGLSYFHNFAALQSIFYTKEFTFATYFTKKDCNFLVKLSSRAFSRPKTTCKRGSAPIVAVKCDACLKVW